MDLVKEHVQGWCDRRGCSWWGQIEADVSLWWPLEGAVNWRFITASEPLQLIFSSVLVIVNTSAYGCTIIRCPVHCFKFKTKVLYNAASDHLPGYANHSCSLHNWCLPNRNGMQRAEDQLNVNTKTLTDVKAFLFIFCYSAIKKIFVTLWIIVTNNHDYHFGHNTSDLIKCEYMWYECVTDGSPLPVKYVV